MCLKLNDIAVCLFQLALIYNFGYFWNKVTCLKCKLSKDKYYTSVKLHIVHLQDYDDLYYFQLNYSQTKICASKMANTGCPHFVGVNKIIITGTVYNLQVVLGMKFVI